jgi:hypothetical protein
MSRTRFLLPLIVLFTLPAIAGVREGMSAVNRGNYETAYTEFSKLAEDGDTRAMITIGSWYYNGKGFEQNYQKAMEWYLKAYEKGNSDAMNNIGVMYRDALGVTQDLEISYALFHLAIEATGNDDTLNRVYRNVEELEIIITREQIQRGKEWLKKGLTAKVLIEHKPAKSAARQKINLMPEEIFKTIPQSYTMTPRNNKKLKTNVIAVYHDTYDEMPGYLGLTSERIEDVNEIIGEERYICTEGRFSVLVPSLSTGEIYVRKTVLRGGVDHQVRFFEKGTEPILPWPVDKDFGHAAVITTQLPEEWKQKDKEVFGIVEQMQHGFVKSLPEEYYHCSVLKGSLGNVFQTIVANRKPSKLYPQADVKICPPYKRLKTIGINRLFFKDCVLIEIALIVHRPEDISEEQFIKYSLKRMDAFMSGFTLLETKRNAGGN